MDLDLDDLLGPVEPTDNAAVALDLAHRGFAVFPITRKADGSWTPIVHWQQRASRDPGVVAEMWRDYPKARVGFPCGQVNGVSVIDVDVKDGKDGCQSLADLGFDPREMTPAIARSPSGGWHLFFQADGRLKNWVGKLGEGLDVRTTGGYVLAPGSFKDGARYEVVGALPSDTSRLPLFPEMLIPVEAAREVGEVVEATERQREWAAEQFAKKVAAFEALTEEGSGRNALVNEIAMWAGGAAAHGMLDHAHVEARLLEAAEKNGHAADRTAQRATRKTISNGWNASAGTPAP